MMVSPRVAETSGSRVSPAAGWLPIILLLALCYIGYFKSTLLLRWVGVDLTAVLALLMSAYIAYRVFLGKRHGWMRGWAVVIALWLAFLPGAVYTFTSDQSLYKTIYLFSITLVSALAASAVFQSESDLRRWIRATIVAGVVIAGIGIVDPNLDYSSTFGRLGIEGTSTIGSARVIGSAFVSVVLMAFVSRARVRIALLGLAIFLGYFLVVIGSRGPLLGSILAIFVALVSARVFRSRRLLSVVAGLSIFAITAYWAVASDVAGLRRVVGFLSGDRVDVARNSLIASSVEAVAVSPIGLGWGGFSFYIMGNPSGSDHPHNLILELFLEGGWVAGFAFLAFAFLAFRRFWLYSDSAPGAVLLALAVYWIAVALTSSDINGNRITIVLLACAFAVPVAERVRVSRRSSTARHTLPSTSYQEVDGGSAT